MNQTRLGEPAHCIHSVATVAELKLAGDLRRRPWERVAQQDVQDAVVAPLLADSGALELVVFNTLALASPPFIGRCSL
jgi:hypothetical protein